MLRPRFFPIREHTAVLISSLWLVLICCLFTACNKNGSKGLGQSSLEQALSEYKQAHQHLLDTYDTEIAAASKLGPEGTNRVTQLKREKAVYAAQNTPVEPGTAIAGLDREHILEMLPGRTWYWHWESRRTDLPFQFNVIGDGEVIGATPPDMKIPKPWKLELRWVFNEGTHLLVPYDDNTLKGFFKFSGRQVGAYANKLR